ncbi:hypothetical protein ACPV36_04975 [Photobacterium damselae]|uniref:hypothetical protein n=1 Tax=Photobacterium damselae TaxID=38293 RepID=UPI004067DA50
MMILTVITLSAALHAAISHRQWGVLILLLVGVAAWSLAGGIPPLLHAIFIGLFVATWQLLRTKPTGAITHEESNHPA